MATCHILCYTTLLAQAIADQMTTAQDDPTADATAKCSPLDSSPTQNTSASTAADLEEALRTFQQQLQSLLGQTAAAFGSMRVNLSSAIDSFSSHAKQSAVDAWELLLTPEEGLQRLAEECMPSECMVNVDASHAHVRAAVGTIPITTTDGSSAVLKESEAVGVEGEMDDELNA